MRGGLIIAAVCAVSVLFLPEARAQARFQNVGPNDCINCHDHQSQRQWYEKGEIQEVQKRFPQKSANAGHINSLKQLEASKSNDFARAIGQADKYDLGGACVRCHATVFAGDANAGVSCESCHGPASGYLKPHQTKGTHAQSLTLGMTDIVGKITAWAEQCTRCHVVDDQRLVAAGHPSGDTFDLGTMFGPVSAHFVKKYSEGDVRAMSQELVRNIIAKRLAPPSATAAGTAPQRPTVAEAPPAPVANTTSPSTAVPVAASPAAVPAARAPASTAGPTGAVGAKGSAPAAAAPAVAPAKAPAIPAPPPAAL